jgi:hypothetical protein
VTRQGDSVRWGSKLGKVGMNTTQLIEHWTMQGAGRNIDGRFRTTDDIREVLAAHHDAPRDAESATLRVRGADEEDWTSLKVGAGEGGSGRTA